ncbi:hypothetical protein J5Y09_23655, partial [Roseomonas sp. PWR1]
PQPRPAAAAAAARPAAPPAEPRPAASPPAPSAAAAAIATPFGDAMFRWRCTSGLLDRLGEAPDWPLRRVAGLCLCMADRLREDGPREMPLPGADLPRALAEAEARLCRRG